MGFHIIDEFFNHFFLYLFFEIKMVYFLNKNISSDINFHIAYFYGNEDVLCNLIALEFIIIEMTELFYFLML